MVGARQTADTAWQARRLLLAIDDVLVEHLTIEDDWLYPTLMAADDPQVRDRAAECSDGMGGILGAWVAYRDQWDEAAISDNLKRFKIATAGIVSALAMRIDYENLELYPAMDRLLQDEGEASAV